MLQAKLSKILVTILVLSTSLQALADCDFNTGVEKMPDGRYAYTESCHKAVGKLVKDTKDYQDALAKKDVQIKDLGVQLTAQTQRADQWMETSLKLQTRVDQTASMKSTNEWVSFGTGVAVTILSVWGASQLGSRR